jgi:NAD(P)H-dependent FMN reductase
MTELTTRLEAADAFILVTPEYNHSYPASLKAAIDWHFTQWTAKPVGPPLSAQRAPKGLTQKADSRDRPARSSDSDGGS